MNKTKNIAVIKTEPEVPITLREYANQYDVCPKTVEQWFKHGKKVTTIILNLSDLTN